MGLHNPAEDRKRKLSKKISLLRREGKPKKQSVAIAQSLMRQKKVK